MADYLQSCSVEPTFYRANGARANEGRLLISKVVNTDQDECLAFLIRERIYGLLDIAKFACRFLWRRNGLPASMNSVHIFNFFFSPAHVSKVRIPNNCQQPRLNCAQVPQRISFGPCH